MNKVINKQGEYRLYKVDGYSSILDMYFGEKDKGGMKIATVSVNENLKNLVEKEEVAFLTLDDSTIDELEVEGLTHSGVLRN
jgi:hypothetical protein